MPALKNSQHEKFALALFKGMSQHDAAIEAGYKASRARQTGSRLVTYGDISERIIELQKLAASDAIMSVSERKERLSEIARARLSDFIEVEEDGTIKKIDIKAGHSAALQEVTVTTFMGGKDQRARERTTRVKLLKPEPAIDILNRMEGEYPAANVLKLEAGETLKPLITDLLGRLRGYAKKE